MFDERRGGGRKICVLAMEKLVFRDNVEKLNQTTRSTIIHIERISLFAFEVRRVREIVDWWMLAEREYAGKVATLADTACVPMNVIHVVILADRRYDSHSSATYSASASSHGRRVTRFETIDSFAGSVIPDGKKFRSTARTFAFDFSCVAIAEAMSKRVAMPSFAMWKIPYSPSMSNFLIACT